MYQKEDILLYDSKNKPLMVYDDGLPVAGNYFNPSSWENLGKYSAALNYTTLGSGEEEVTQYDRETLVRVSRKLFATMPEVAAAINQMANLTIGLGSSPIFTGENPVDQEWGDATEYALENIYYPNITPYGIAYDWRTIWKLVIVSVARDGDILMVPYLDRKGMQKFEFIESHRIGNRSGHGEVDSGRYEGYAVRDGVVINSSGFPIAYQVKGETKDDDYIISTDNAYLIYNPFSFSKYRGLPILKSAMGDAASLKQIEDNIEMVSKVETAVYLQVKNDTGQAPRSRVKMVGAQTTPTNTAGSTTPIREDIYGGIRYVRTKDDIKSFQTSRPSDQSMRFLQHLSKGVMLATEIPYQWILNPESVSGPSARGVKEQIAKAVQNTSQMINKYQLIAIKKMVVNGMQNGLITPNYKNDNITRLPVYSSWSLSQASELILDQGNQIQSDINLYLNGLISADEILQKYGRRYKKTLSIRAKNVRQLLTTVQALENEFPAYKTAILNLMQKEDFVMPPLPNEVVSQQSQ